MAIQETNSGRPVFSGSHTWKNFSTCSNGASSLTLGVVYLPIMSYMDVMMASISCTNRQHGFVNYNQHHSFLVHWPTARNCYWLLEKSLRASGNNSINEIMHLVQ